jgi:cytoskeletal protein CcmA (bactofilin family)
MAKKTKDLNKLNTVSGKDSEFSGEGTIVIWKNGRVQTDIRVSKIINYGEIVGNIIADETIEVSSVGPKS